MSGYWDTVPKGTWTVVDPEDALMAIRDQESRAVQVKSYDGERIHVYGPIGKALIIDLESMKKNIDNPQEYQHLRNILLTYC